MHSLALVTVFCSLECRFSVDYGCPWDEHPGFSGPLSTAGPTRIIGARVKPTLKNAANEITPASVEAVQVEVALAGAGPATLKAALKSETFSVGATCNDAAGRDVNAFENDVEVFEIDARSLPDGELSFEIQLNGDTYLVPGPVIKNVNGISFPDTPAKKIVNIVLSGV